MPITITLSESEYADLIDAVADRAEQNHDLAGQTGSTEDDEQVEQSARDLDALGDTLAAAQTRFVQLTERPHVAAVVAALLTDPLALAVYVGRALATAGAQTDWDSQTVEDVLSEVETHSTRYGLPNVGDTVADVDALSYWRAVADEVGIGHDGPTEGDEVEA